MAAKQQAFAINPGKGLGFLLLGGSLRDVLTRLRSQPDLFPKLKVQFSAVAPVTEPLNVVLPENGMRLRFDGPDQRLRLIEVLDFGKVPLTYKGQELVKTQEGEPVIGPSFRHVYSKLFGPTFEGEHFTPTNGTSSGLYVLSYPGVAFSFNVMSWPENSDFVSVLSSSSTGSAVALSIFNGSSWKDARKDLYTRPCPSPRSLGLVGRPKDFMSDEIELAVIKGNGHVEFRRRALQPFNLHLGETTPQDLILTLGPPDAIYRKNDRRLSIHKEKPTHRDHPEMASSPPDRHTDTDRSSISTATDYSSPEDEPTSNREQPQQECFYNYFSHGLDIFMSHTPTSSPPLLPPSNQTTTTTNTTEPESDTSTHKSASLVATKLFLHGNVPGSHSFNRHRRSRWILDPAIMQLRSSAPISSETSFSSIRSTMDSIWTAPQTTRSAGAGTSTSTSTGAVTSTSTDIGTDPSSRLAQHRHMVLNRGWGDSPGSSIELLGGWEDADADLDLDLDLDLEVEGSTVGGEGERQRKMGLGNTELYGWPGLLFEVLKNDVVECVTVY